MRILLAEDDPKLLKSLIHIFRNNRYITDGVSNGADAFNYVATGEYDGIVMDIMMPEVDGCEAARLIRSQQRADAETVIILALTANSFAEDVIRTMESGMNAHLVKPINMKILQETVQKLLKKKNEG